MTITIATVMAVTTMIIFDDHCCDDYDYQYDADDQDDHQCDHCDWSYDFGHYDDHYCDHCNWYYDYDHL